MSGRLRDKRCFLTAAGQGIGRAAAEAFLAEGAEVIATDLDAAKLAPLEQAGATVAALDATDAAAIAEAGHRFGPVQVLFNCAGIVHHGDVLAASEAQWEAAFALNVTSQFRLIRAFLPGMLAGGGGSIVNISSVVSSVKGLPNRCIYGTTKAAVIGLTKSVAADYVGRGVRCNAIAPGTVETPSLQGRIDAFEDPEQARRDFIARQPMGRLGTPEEVAALAVYLASDESAFCTGQVWVIDGGVAL